jgi:hypothetical protein
MKAYIISYFGTRERLLDRANRVINHKRQIDWWHLQDPKLEFVILAMDYDPHEFLTYDYIDYIVHPTVLSGQARNKLLEIFYASNDPWALFMDNDVILKQHKQWPHTNINLNHILIEKNELLRNIDIIEPHHDFIVGDGAFTRKYNNTDPKYSNINWNKELCFDYSFLTLCSRIFWLKNLKPNLYFSEDIFPGEDHDFALRMYMQNYGVYRLRNIISYELPVKSSWEIDVQLRLTKLHKTYRIMAQRYNLPPERRNWKRYLNKLKVNDHLSRVVIPYN